MKKIKSYDKFIKAKFNPKPSKKTYGWMPDPKVKVTKVKEELDFKKSLAGAGILGSMLTATPDIKAQDTTNVIQAQIPGQVDLTKSKENAEELKNIRLSQSGQIDTTLSSILGEIEQNISSEDQAKFKELYTKLSSHIEEKYGYRIEPKNVEQEFSEANMLSQTKGMTLFEILGWLGSICLAICGIPQAWQSIKDKHSHGISWGFVLLWSFGEIFALAYVYDKLDLPLLLNYATNILILSIILYYKIRPQKTADYDKEVRRFH